MKILTKYHGEIEINENEIITFEKGIPGFEEEAKYVIIPYEESSPFFILQSVSNENLAFVTVDIFSINPQYDYVIQEHIIDLLEIKKPEDVLTLGIVTVKEDFNESTVNMYAPVVINIDARLGKQIVLSESNYLVRTPLFVKST